MQWNGTCDWSPYLSTLAALEFRKRCGGEARINDYCHQLAVKGGQVIASILGTEVMKNEEGDGELIANMVILFIRFASVMTHPSLTGQRTAPDNSSDWCRGKEGAVATAGLPLFDAGDGT